MNRHCEVVEESPYNEIFYQNNYLSFIDLPTPNDWSIICQAGIEFKYEEGQTIVDYFDRFQYFYIIQSGQCFVEYINSNSDISSFQLTTYQCFGEFSFLTGVPSMYRVYTSSPDATILRIDPLCLKRIAYEHPETCARFLRYICCVLHQLIVSLRANL